MYRIAADDVETLQGFVEESSDYLAFIEEALLKLETDADKAALLNDIFRHVHTIKGLSGFLDLSEISAFTHRVESLLDALRKEKLKLSSDIVTVLLDSSEILGAMLCTLRQAYADHAGGDLKIGSLSSAETEKLCQAIETILNAPAGASSQPPPQLPLGSAPEAQSPENGGSQSDMAESGGLAGKISGEAVLADFLPEAEEHLDYILHSLLPLFDGSQVGEKPPLAELFRRMHTIKGLLGLLASAQERENGLFFSARGLVEVFQELETIISRIQSGEIGLTTRVVDLCYAAGDSLLLFIDRCCQQAEPDPCEVLAPWRKSWTPRSDTEKKEKLPPCPVDGQPILPAGAEARGSSATILVSEEKMDRLLNIAGELAVGRNFWFQLAKKLAVEYNLPGLAREVREQAQWAGRLTGELEDCVMSIRMVEIKNLFQKFPRVVRDIALKSNKQISVRMEGENTELDKKIIEQISDPLLHIVRNAADHGIETIAERKAAGKPAEGTVVLRAYRQGKHVVVEVQDDGKGIDPAAIKAKAVEKGFISSAEANSLNDKQALQLIFLPGFSTASTVSDISGRGVGMDVVKTKIASLKGHVFIDSAVGVGSTFSLYLPLTLLVSRGLLVEAGKEAFIFPLENILETIKIDKNKAIQRKGGFLYHHRGRIMGIKSLTRLLGLDTVPAGSDLIPVVIVGDGHAVLGIAVDRLIHEQDVIVKPLPDHLAASPGIAGAAILNDGRVALVLDIPQLMNMGVQKGVSGT